MSPFILLVLPWALSHPASEHPLNGHLLTDLATSSHIVNKNERSINSELVENRTSPLYQLINVKQFPADINNFGLPDLNFRPSVSHTDEDRSQKGRSVFALDLGI